MKKLVLLAILAGLLATPANAAHDGSGGAMTVCMGGYPNGTWHAWNGGAWVNTGVPCN